jgi:hypothetical protein
VQSGLKRTGVILERKFQGIGKMRAPELSHHHASAQLHGSPGVARAPHAETTP